MADLVEIVLALRNVRQFVSGADSASKAITKVGTETDKTGKKAKSGATGLLKFAAGGAAVYGATRYLKSAVTDASDLSEEINKTSVVFGKSSAGLLQWSKTSADSLAMSRQQALNATGTFGNMLVPMGFARDRAAAMSKRMVQLGADMSSFNNASPEETLQALRSGLAGETEPLRRFGVFLSAARVQAKAMSMGLVKGVKDTLSIKRAQMATTIATGKAAIAFKKHGANSMEYRKALLDVDTAEAKLKKTMAGKMPQLDAAQKAQATYALMLQDTKAAQGDLVRTSGGLANRQRILQARFKDISTNVGEQFLPVVVQLAGALLTFLKLLVPLTKNTTLFRIAIGLLVGLFVAYKVAMLISTLSTLAFNTSLLVTLGIIAAVVIILAALAYGFYYAYKRVGWFHDAVDATWAAIKVGAAWVWDQLKQFFSWLKTNWPYVLGILAGPFGLAVVVIVKHFDAIKKKALATIASIKQAFLDLINFVKDAPGRVGRGALGALGKVGGVAGQLAGKAWPFAAGGTMPRAGTALVGERGPELLRLPGGATITPLPAAAGPSIDAGSMFTVNLTSQLVVDRRVIAQAVTQYVADRKARR